MEIYYVTFFMPPNGSKLEIVFYGHEEASIVFKALEDYAKKYDLRMPLMEQEKRIEVQP